MQTFPEELFLPAELELHHEEVIAPSYSFWKEIWNNFKQRRVAAVGLVVLVLLSIMAVIGPYLTPYTYYDINLPLKNQPPSTMFWFGSDDLGRDIFTRVWYGARISLFIGIAAALIDLALGAIWGGTAALIGGKTDEIMMRFADILYSLPYLIVVTLLMMIMGPGLLTILAAMTIIGWITMARIVRGQVLHLKQQEYVLAAQALGASLPRILFRHLLPNARPHHGNADAHHSLSHICRSLPKLHGAGNTSPNSQLGNDGS